MTIDITKPQPKHTCNDGEYDRYQCDGCEWQQKYNEDRVAEHYYKKLAIRNEVDTFLDYIISTNSKTLSLKKIRELLKKSLSYRDAERKTDAFLDKLVNKRVSD
jgi:hypothetical protein